MTSRSVQCVMCVLLGVALAGCRQADGPMPQAIGETPNRLSDISRDLAGVAGGDAAAPRDLTDDLQVFVGGNSDATRAVGELARRTSGSIAGKPLTDQNGQRLAHQLWTAVAARELSDRQVETLQNEMNALLVSIGVPEESAINVASQVSEVQKLVTAKPRRWYEVF